MENGSSGSPPAAAASCPPWVMLNHYGYRHSIVAETKTTAVAARTSTNLLFHVSLLLAAPTANSWLHYGWWDSSSISQDAEGEKSDALSSVAVIAAHGGALLLEVNYSSDKHGHCGTKMWDYFLYETGMVQLRPPSLLKLPGCYFPYLFDPNTELERTRVMSTTDTGLLRCVEDDDHLLVAQLEVSRSDDEPRDRADLSVLRVSQEWELKRGVPILFGDHPGSTSNTAMPRRWEADLVVPVGDRYLCWVDYLLGFLFCDMATDDANLKLRYVTLPVVPPKDVEYWDNRPYKRYCRDLAGAGAAAVRFVNIEPRCCCGGHGRSTCARGQFLFTVTTWTLSLGIDEPLEWMKEGVLDCNELWALPAYKGLPHVTPEYPVVSLDNPDVIWLVVLEDVQDYTKFADRKVWVIEVDTRSKAVLSVVPSTNRWWSNSHVPVKLRR